MKYGGPCILRMRGSRVRERAGSQGALALTCSGGAGAARVPGRCSRRSPAPDQVPGPSPFPGFSAPPCTLARLPGPPALSAPPHVRPLREQEPKREGSEDRSQGRGREERWTLRGRDPGARVSSSAVLGPPGLGDPGTQVAPP